MRKLFFAFLICNFCALAQDTIRFSDGEVRAIEIAEVTSFGVKYYHFNNPQSKLLFAAKKDISYVKYQNGEIDSLKKKVKPLAVAGEEKSLQNPGLAYDTIVFRTGQKKVVKVTEVSGADIKYKPVDYAEGPAYTIEKSKIKYIKYSNGITDSFPDLESAKANASSQKPRPIDPANEKITIIGKKLIFREEAVGDKGMLFILKNIPDGDKKNKMQNTYREMRRYKRIQHAFVFTSFATIYVTAVGASWAAMSALYGNVVPEAGIIALVGGGVFSITTGVISSRFKKKRTEKKLELAHIFNE